MNCQMFSCGFNSGHLAGGGINVTLDRTILGAGAMPSGRIDQKRHVRTRHDLRRDLGEIEIHRPGVAPRLDERCLCRLGRDRAEEAVRRSLGPKDAFPPLVKDKSNEDVEVFALRAEVEHLTAASLEQQS